MYLRCCRGFSEGFRGGRCFFLCNKFQQVFRNVTGGFRRILYISEGFRGVTIWSKETSRGFRSLSRELQVIFSGFQRRFREFSERSGRFRRVAGAKDF